MTLCLQASCGSVYHRREQHTFLSKCTFPRELPARAPRLCLQASCGSVHRSAKKCTLCTKRPPNASTSAGSAPRKSALRASKDHQTRPPARVPRREKVHSVHQKTTKRVCQRGLRAFACKHHAVRCTLVASSALFFLSVLSHANCQRGLRASACKHHAVRCIVPRKSAFCASKDHQTRPPARVPRRA